MDKICLVYGIEITNFDWENTPASVKQLVEKMGQQIKESEKRLADLEAQQQELLEKINSSSKNSSSPHHQTHPMLKSVKKRRRAVKSEGDNQDIKVIFAFCTTYPSVTAF